MSKEERLRQIIDELFTIAQPGPLKDALWKSYQNISEQPDALELRLEGMEETLLHLSLELNQVCF